MGQVVVVSDRLSRVVRAGPVAIMGAVLLCARVLNWARVVDTSSQPAGRAAPLIVPEPHSESEHGGGGWGSLPRWTVLWGRKTATEVDTGGVRL